MNGHDGKGGGAPFAPLPEEGRLAASNLPSPGQTASVPPPSIAATTPGVSSSVLRHPGAPTLPDPEPAGLTLAVATLANQLFTTPYGVLPVEAPNEATLSPGLSNVQPSPFTNAAQPPHTYGGAPSHGVPGNVPSEATHGPDTFANVTPSEGAKGDETLGVAYAPFENPLDFSTLEGMPHYGLPGGMPNGIPTGVPAGIPSGIPTNGIPAPQSAAPNGMLHGMPSGGQPQGIPASGVPFGGMPVNVDVPRAPDPTPSFNSQAAQHGGGAQPVFGAPLDFGRHPDFDAHPDFARQNARPADPRATAPAVPAVNAANQVESPYANARNDGHRGSPQEGLAFEQPRPGHVPDSGSYAPYGSHEPHQAHAPYANHPQHGRTASHGVSGGGPAMPGHQAGRTERHEKALYAEPRFGSKGSGAFDPLAIKREFPILHQKVNGHDLVWLDNAATTQKPQTVIDRLSAFYSHENSNIHRAAHTLAARATDAYETARESVRRFINAATPREIVFVRGATEGINLVAQSWGRRNIGPGDEIVVSHLEHHANIVPWQMLAREKGAKLRVAPVDDRGEILLDEYEKLLNSRTKLVAFTQVSNALGTVTPAHEMIAAAHRVGACVLLDGAQAVSHKRVDVQSLGCDFYVLSGHKVFAPTGIGVVYGRSEILEVMPPWQGGGNMIEDVTFERTVYQPAPARFEAGTGNIADAVGLGTALDWLSRVGLERVEAYEHELLVYGTERLQTVPGLTMIGTAREKAGVLSFVLAGQNTPEVGGMLDKEGIAVRSGHHCAQPILRRFGLEHTVRASLAPYNTKDDLDHLVAALKRIQVGHVGVPVSGSRGQHVSAI